MLKGKLRPRADAPRHGGSSRNICQFLLVLHLHCISITGAERPCEVTMAKHQGMYGQDSLDGGARRFYKFEAMFKC